MIFANKFNSGLPDNWIHTIAIDEQGNKWIGTEKGVAIYREGWVKLDVENQKNEISQKYNLMQNYPNPFDQKTKICWSVPTAGHQTIKVFDVLGNEVLNLVDEDLPIGEYTIEVDGSLLRSAIYYYQLQCRGFIETKKMVVIKWEKIKEKRLQLLIQ